MNSNNKNRNTSQRKLTPQQAEMLKKRRDAERRKKLKIKRTVERIKAIAFFSLIGAILCLAAIFGYIFVDFFHDGKGEALPLKITVGGEEPFFLDDSEYYISGGEYFVSLTHLSSKLGFTIHGKSGETMTLSIEGNDVAAIAVGTQNVLCGNISSVMSSPSVFKDEQLFVPSSFFEICFDGVKIEYNKAGGKKGYNIIFDSEFSLLHTNDSGTDAISRADINALKAEQMPEFVSDLSEYERYMNPENRDEYLVLINTSHPLSADYVPDDLEEVLYTRGDRAKQKMRLYAAKALEAMFVEMRANGFTDVSVTSGYRSYEYQKQLFDSRVNALIPSMGEEKAKKSVMLDTAIPGSSEHQSGLCADLHNLSYASEAFAAEEAYRWLCSHCADFGFILRYPKNKTDITGITFEPWHYRYVGRYHARKITDSGVCLEEYIEQYTNTNKQ